MAQVRSWAGALSRGTVDQPPSLIYPIQVHSVQSGWSSHSLKYLHTSKLVTSRPPATHTSQREGDRNAGSHSHTKQLRTCRNMTRKRGLTVKAPDAQRNALRTWIMGGSWCGGAKQQDKFLN